MNMYCEGNSHMQYNEMIFSVLLFEVCRNNYKNLRSELHKIDSIIDCEKISDNLLLVVRLKLSFLDNDSQQAIKYMCLLMDQLPDIYNHNNYLPLTYIRSFLVD